MNEFYKFIHQKFTDSINKKEDGSKIAPKNLSNMTKVEMYEIVRQFIEKYVSPTIFITDELSEVWKEQIVISMMVFLFSHRHTKADQFIVETK